MSNICTPKPYPKAWATPPNAEREIQFRAALKSTGHDSTRGTRTHVYISNVK